MSRAGHITHILIATGFVASGLAVVMHSRGLPRLEETYGSGGALTSLSPDLAGRTSSDLIQHLYLRPENPVMWALLVVLFLLVLLDAGGEVIESPARKRRGGHGVCPALALALIGGALWPWLDGQEPLIAAVCAILTAISATVASVRASNQHRPAIGFLAGWSTGLAAASLAAVIAEQASLGISQTAIVAILPAAIMGMAVQHRLGRSFSYSVALIWAFCGLAATTMGTAPMAALAAILGITAMTAALIRAAS
ncbi:hypothetical protein J7376_03005 [Paracoccus sp. R12_1]|uniref:hypothetical protein n=1 Tax=unclassified Paracoccus (in: a-proteobacteria) TaxID=2688777 RepID=UPI001ADCE0A3|nr:MULTISPECIES: hypothetical protein [unclassified Paracoccus (in: a-proteobacteria)]MBO9454835.1 hypothetical protein [Paracoccus sp. R12_2]MBO9485477.1 hypothetical protein [Paracoccus sp. R12_1]